MMGFGSDSIQNKGGYYDPPAGGYTATGSDSLAKGYE